jgi:prepilin-type N-terminal cleavage/methylation domain-containing protein/prepilin-type processing-associated H-X9-DG protein
MRKPSRAFTLVELLVVIALIALLIAMLLPTLNKAKLAAQSSVCLSNLRQCAMGFQLYANDNRGTIPVARTRLGNISMWPKFLSHGFTSTDDPGATVYVPRKSLICPTTPYYAKDYTSTSLSYESMRVGYALYTVKGTSRMTFRNGYQSTKYLDGLPPATSIWWFVYQKPTRLSEPATTTVMLADSFSTHGSSLDGGGHMIGSFTDQDASDYAGRIHLLHPKDRANVAFYDGHAASLTAQELRNDTSTQAKHFVDAMGKAVIIP